MVKKDFGKLLIIEAVLFTTWRMSPNFDRKIWESSKPGLMPSLATIVG